MNKNAIYYNNKSNFTIRDVVVAVGHPLYHHLTTETFSEDLS